MLEQAISLEPNLAAAHYNLGIVYDHLGRLPEALRATRQAVASDTEHWQARAHLCELHLTLKQEKEAISCYEESVKSGPPDARALSNYGSALRRGKRLHDALVILERTVALFPAGAEAYSQVGVVLIETGRYDKAIVALKRALELAPNLDEPRYNLAVAELVTRNRRGALEQYAFLKRSNSVLAQQLYQMLYRKNVLMADQE
jgi:tetratricopeptide (TPR) repeat protein